MHEGSETPKPKRIPPIKQRIIATGIALGIGIPASIGALNNNHKPDELPLNEPIVRVLQDNINFYPRETNSRVRDWENKVYSLINNGEVGSVSKIKINVSSGDEPVKLRTIPLYDQSSGDLQPQVQAELLPGFGVSFYGFDVNDQLGSLDSKDGNWFVVFLPTNEGEKPNIVFLDVGPLTSQSVTKEQDSIQISGIHFDDAGFPIAQIGGQDQRIGVITPTSTPNQPGK